MIAKTMTADRRNRKTSLQRSKLVVGWREWLSLPDLGIELIKAKVDTGARTSALHAFDIAPFQQNGDTWVRFNIHPLQRNDVLILPCTCRALDYRWVTNSGGGREQRFVIETLVHVGDEAWPIEVTLTSRDQMGFRMLLGRTAIRKHFVVDPGRSFCASSARWRKRQKRHYKEASGTRSVSIEK
ncbi:MAG: ATP-dependent zinc protease [Alphaproteobacteria bacterium]|nr:ATP-dependent zinc protease [Alphaproteobacteria bacterium]